MSGAVSALTYNVQGLPDALSDSPRPTADRMVDIAPHLDAFDVVGLQETFDTDWHALLVADATHGQQEWTTYRESDRVYSAGLGVLSRLGSPVDYNEFYFEGCHGGLSGSGDCLATKGFQVLTVEVAPGAHVDLINTHHEAGGGPEDEAVRAAQVEHVIAALNPDHAIVFMGDTNLRPSDPPDAELLARYAQAGLLDACQAVGCPEPDHIDRVMVRSSDAVELTVTDWQNRDEFVDTEGAPLSDHPAIATTLEWSTMATP